MEEDGVHRLEGSSEQKGGLIVKKKTPTFKIPQPSLLGLDKLAEKKRREQKDAARKMSFTVDDEESNPEMAESPREKHSGDHRKFRSPHAETPTYTGGITEEARRRLLERLTANKNKEKGVYASTKEEKKNRNYESSSIEKKRSYTRDEYDRKRHDREKSEHHSSRREKTPHFRDEPRTPNIRLKNEPSKTSWDDEEDVPSKRSAWDFPTPSVYKSGGDWSERSTKSKRSDFPGQSSSSNRSSRDHQSQRYEDDTPRPTPAHRYNAWAKDRKRSGATPGLGKEEGLKWDGTVDRELWEEEQQRIDREWYNMDEGEYEFIGKCTIKS